jgi:hypothetical protein
MTDLDLDRLVSRAMLAVGHLARKGSLLTLGVAVIALVVAGAAYLVGLAAFDDGTHAVWLVLGALIVIAAVGAPLVATWRLLAVPRHADDLTVELRALLGRNADARRIVVDTVVIDEEPAAANTAAPTVIVQSGQFNTLHRIAVDSGDVDHLAQVTRDLATLPSLLFIGLCLTGFAGALGFLFTLIWIF